MDAPLYRGSNPAVPAGARRKRTIWPLIVGMVVVAAALVVAVLSVTHTRASVVVTSVTFSKSLTADNVPAPTVAAFRATDPEIFIVLRLNATDSSIPVRIVVTLTEGTDPATTRPVTNIPIATFDGTAGSTTILWSVARTGPTPWPVGLYRVEVSLNGALSSSTTFTVAV